MISKYGQMAFKRLLQLNPDHVWHRAELTKAVGNADLFEWCLEMGAVRHDTVNVFWIQTESIQEMLEK